MTIYLARTFTPEFLDGFDYAYLPVNKELAQTVLLRRKAFLEAQKLDDTLSSHEYRDYSVNYLPYSEALDEVIPYDGPEVVPVPTDFVLDEETVERTECDVMHISADGVRWICVPKYVDGMSVETVNIPFSVFESEL